MIGSIAVSLVAAAIGIYCSYLPIGQARNVQWFGAGALVGGLSYLIGAGAKRYLTERRAGRVLFQLPWTVALFSKVHRAILLPGQLMLAGMLAAQLAFGTWIAAQLTTTNAHVILSIAGGLLSATLMGMLFASLWNRHVLLCERGILYGGRTTPWLILAGFLRRVAMIVPADQREVVESLLRDKLGAEGTNTADGAAQPRFPVASHGKKQPLRAGSPE
jgi:hypothetical protein